MSIFQDLLTEIERYKRGYELLAKLYYEVGPYRQKDIRDETWQKVKDFFGFDDSE